MNCKEFREISEAYLSDELLVETNLQVFRHLEDCPKCRDEFRAKSALRRRMRAAVQDAERFRATPAFALNLRARLESEAASRGNRRAISALRFLIPAMALLVIAIGLGYRTFTSRTAPGLPAAVAQAVSDAARRAAGNHVDCALAKSRVWEEMSTLGVGDEAKFSNAVLEPLKSEFSPNIELLHAHDCIFEGVPYKHAVLRDGQQIISVFVDRTELLVKEAGSSTIFCEKGEGFQIASFRKDGRMILVVSGLSESENLKAARSLSDRFAPSALL